VRGLSQRRTSRSGTRIRRRTSPRRLQLSERTPRPHGGSDGPSPARLGDRT